MSSSTLQPEPTFEETWGTFVALVYVSTVLSGFIAMQTCTYFHKFFHRDHYILKYTVACIGFGCVTLVLCELWVLHGIIIAGYHLPSEQVTVSLGLPITLAVGVVVSCAVQGVYVFRMYRFNRSRYLLACFCVLGGMEVGTGFAWTVPVTHAAPAWQDAMSNEESKWPIGISFVATVLLDTFIASSTCYQLWRSRMTGLKRTRHMVDKLMRWTVRKLPPYLPHS
ncbi:hypothetical protein BD779DRAFT_1704001 [Infundibulicybe gibba]|nr:hypothetical protein BD779DRAFT_1704001 [Infundibulicybe gibba]